MADTEGFTELKRRLAGRTNTNADEWHLTFKARQAMQVAFQAAHAATGRTEVVTQVFTCVTAVDPILSASLTPVYADVEKDTLSVDLSTVRLGDDTCAVVLQHTFGLIDPVSDRKIVDAAHAAGAIVVEDCAHCIGRMSVGKDGKPLADVSIHSFGVEKVLPGVYFGGAAWVNPELDSKMHDHIVGAFKTLPEPVRTLTNAAKQYRNQIRLLTRVPQNLSTRMRERWVRRGVFEPAVADKELRGKLSRTPSLPSDWVVSEDLKALEGIQGNENGRVSCVESYRKWWGADEARSLGVCAPIMAGDSQPLLRMPIFFETAEVADEAIRIVSDLGYYAVAWPRPLLLPGVKKLAPYGIESFDAWPVSVRLSRGICALPTDIDSTQVHVVAEAMRELSRKQKRF